MKYITPSSRRVMPGLPTSVMTFLSIVTRCHPNRPRMLAQNIVSVERQTDPDYERVFIHDDVGRGVAWANMAIGGAYPAGDYVLILDDDDMLINDEAIAKLKTAARNQPELVVFRADHAGLGILPSARVWEQQPQVGHIGSCDFITRRDIWQAHIHTFNQPTCGDLHFLKSVWETEPEVVWLDETLAGVQRISKGRPE